MPETHFTLSLTETVRELRRLEELLAAEKKAAEERFAALEQQIQDHRFTIGSTEMGLDAEKIAVAQTILEIRGDLAPLVPYGAGARSAAPRRAAAVRKAMDDLADEENPGGGLWRRYRGVKNYDRFGDQGCDCSYGMGPRHGHIVFEVGFRREFLSLKRELTPPQVEACVYYLANLQRIQTAEREAAKDEQGVGAG